MSDFTFTKNLENILPNLKSLKEIGINKPLAKIGDSVTNLIYSLAKSMVLGYFEENKVNRTILSHALKKADMKVYAKTRSDSHALADTVEAFIGYIYCAEHWNIETLVEILFIELQKHDLTNYSDEQIGATEAFTILLQKIKEALFPKFSQ